MKYCFVIVSLSLTFALPAVPLFAATTITTQAYALFSDIRVASAVGVTVHPLAKTSGTALLPYNVDNKVLSFGTNIDLGLVGVTRAGLGINSGLLTSNSTANGTLPGDTSAGSAISRANNLAINLFTKVSILPALTTLGLTADTINSTTTVTRLGNSAMFTGTSVIENLNLQLLSLLDFGLGANARVSPNTVLINEMGIRVTLNEQIIGGNGGSSQSLTTNAIAIVLDDYLLGGRLLTGNLIVGSSYAAIDMDDISPPSAIPEPAMWLQLIAGFGLTGAMLRCRKTVAA